MVRGEVKFIVEQMGTRPMSPFSTGLPMETLPNIMEMVESRPHWEEKTGEKTGFIIKREGKRRMTLIGYRCTLCNYIELFAREK